MYMSSYGYSYIYIYIYIYIYRGVSERSGGARNTQPHAIAYAIAGVCS